MAQSDAEIRGYIERSLGGGVVTVELTEDQYNDAIFESKMWFMGHIGQMKNKVLQISASGGAFDVADDCLSVAEVYFDKQRDDLFDQFDWAGVELNPLAFGMYGGYYGDSVAGGGYSMLVQSLQYRETARRVLSTDRDWEWDYQAKKLRIYPTNGDIGTQVFVVYFVDDLDVSKVRPYEYQLIRRFAFASAMETLGYIRTKYSDGPSATGSMTLNGSDLLANSDLIKDTCNQQILTIKPPANFFAG